MQTEAAESASRLIHNLPALPASQVWDMSAPEDPGFPKDESGNPDPRCGVLAVVPSIVPLCDKQPFKEQLTLIQIPNGC